MTEKPTKPNCFTCDNRRAIPGDAHIACASRSAMVVGNYVGIAKGWFHWPLNFDPTWLVSCDGHSDNKKDDGNAS